MHQSPRILVVDDEKLTRWAVMEELRGSGYTEIQEAPSAESMLEALASQSFDLVLLDIGLPGISGVDGLVEMRRRNHDVNVVMVTANDDPDDILKCLRHGAVDYLCKPFDIAAVSQLIERHCGGSQPAEPPPDDDDPLGAFVGQSEPIRLLRQQVRKIAASAAQTILIQGASGSGKSILARTIHARGRRAKRPFLEINCAALPAALLESELFGHEKGAFTDAKAAKQGLFELANGGVLLLDEIGDMEAPLQAKLLSAIEERRFKRVGGVTDIAVDVCLIATTNVDLASAVEEGRFRLDLYYRLNIVPLHVPPLREHSSDIPLLVTHLIERLNSDLGTEMHDISKGALSLLQRYDWPGNVRELRNVLEQIMVLNSGPRLMVDHLPADLVKSVMGANAPVIPVQSSPRSPVTELLEQGLSLDEVEQELIRQALAQNDGNLSQAGQKLGLHRDTLRYRARKYGLID